MSDGQRRLAAIVAADIAGYSRLIGADEEGTIAALKALRRDIIDPKLAQYQGRIANTAGDSVLVEFPSAVDALRCAIVIQEEINTSNQNISEEKRLVLRIGINVGDVIADGEDLLGDGVNVAARLENLAEPGGICISRTARDQVRDKLNVELVDHGEVEVKNIARPVRAFSVGKSSRKPFASKWPSQKHLWAASLAGILAFVIAGGAAIWWPNETNKVTENALPTAPKEPALTLLSGPKIVVLPFENIGAGEDQEYFVDGLTEDLITRLTRYAYLNVIGRNTAFQYKNIQVDLRQLAKDIGVEYVLQGSLRRSQNRIRINAQLQSTKNENILWADTFDRPLEARDLFDIQDELAENVVAAIGGYAGGGAIFNEIVSSAKTQRPDDLTAYECVLLADYFLTVLDFEVLKKAKKCLPLVVEKYPEYADAWSESGGIAILEYNFSQDHPKELLTKAIKYSQKALEIDPTRYGSHLTIAFAEFQHRNKEATLSAVEKELNLSPHNPSLLAQAGGILMKFGQWDRGMALTRKAISLDPYPRWDFHWNIGAWHFNNEDYQKALDAYQRINISVGFWKPVVEAALYAELGQQKEAARKIEEVLLLKPDIATTFRDEMLFWWWPMPEYVERWAVSLRKAGLDIPEQIN